MDWPDGNVIKILITSWEEIQLFASAVYLCERVSEI